MITSRRRFLGLLAAPAIVSITGKVHAALAPLSLVIQPTKLIVPPHLEDFTTDTLRYRATERYAHGFMSERFRQIVEPILRQHFEEAYKEIEAREGPLLEHAEQDGVLPTRRWLIGSATGMDPRDALLDGHGTLDRRLRSASGALRARQAARALRGDGGADRSRPYGTAGH